MPTLWSGQAGFRRNCNFNFQVKSKLLWWPQYYFEFQTAARAETKATTSDKCAATNERVVHAVSWSQVTTSYARWRLRFSSCYIAHARNR